MKSMEEMIQAAQKAAETIQKQMTETQAKLDSVEVEGLAGGGLVKIRCSAKGRVIGVAIDDSLMQPSEKPILEDLIAAAYNDARAKADQAAGAIDLELEVRLSTTRSRELGLSPDLVSRSNLRELYWTPAQLVAHHTSNGCNLRPGDLLGTGTVSGSQPEASGCLLERTWRGTEPLTLSSGEVRRFLEDGDEVLMESPLLPALQCLGRIGPAPSGW